jgi:hypothetical protein
LRGAAPKKVEQSSEPVALQAEMNKERH